MTPIPYFTFQGDCAEAMAKYADVFGGTFRIVLRADERPDDFTPPKGQENWVMHAEVAFSDGVIYGSDDLMGGTPPMAGMSIAMNFPTAREAQAAFEALADGGDVRTPFAPTFWSAGFGTLRDRWGKNWMISTTQTGP
ncbi:MAG: VOC family protein [Pseudomonadota bacterium]